MTPHDRARIWRPAVPGIHEVLHAHFTQHAYPAHTHSEWTMLLVDSGAVAYQLGGADRIAAGATVTLLPPHVAHDGRAADPTGFRKRVVYLDESWLPSSAIGPSVDRPQFTLHGLVTAVSRLHREVAHAGDELAAEATLLWVRERILARLCHSPVTHRSPGRGMARELRGLLDSRVVRGITLAEAGRLLGAHPSSLGRAFHDEFGIAPHAYLIGRRIDRARHLLREGSTVADAAHASGFYDQAHLSRHFMRLLGLTPAGYRQHRSQERATP